MLCASVISWETSDQLHIMYNTVPTPYVKVDVMITWHRVPTVSCSSVFTKVNLLCCSPVHRWGSRWPPWSLSWSLPSSQAPLGSKCLIRWVASFSPSLSSFEMAADTKVDVDSILFSHFNLIWSTSLALCSHSVTTYTIMLMVNCSMLHWRMCGVHARYFGVVWFEWRQIHHFRRRVRTHVW